MHICIIYIYVLPQRLHNFNFKKNTPQHSHQFQYLHYARFMYDTIYMWNVAHYVNVLCITLYTCIMYYLSACMISTSAKYPTALSSTSISAILTHIIMRYTIHMYYVLPQRLHHFDFGKILHSTLVNFNIHLLSLLSQTFLL